MKKIIFFAILAGVIVFIFVVGCPIRRVTGIPCPGCGMSRAFLSLFHLDFHSAFYYHPLFPLVIILALAFIICVFIYARKNNKKVFSLEGRDLHIMMESLFSHKITIVIICVYVAAFIVQYIIRFPILISMQ